MGRVNNKDWRRQMQHFSQFDRPPHELRELDLMVSDSQLIALHADGIGFWPMVVEHPDHDSGVPLLDEQGMEIVRPWPVEFVIANFDLYRELDDELSMWREWPSFTGWMPEAMGCSCCNYDLEPRVVAIPTWELFIPLSADEADVIQTAAYSWWEASNYDEWWHYWESQYYGDQEQPRPSEEINLKAFMMPNPSLQERWERVLYQMDHNRQLCRTIRTEQMLRAQRKLDELQKRNVG